MLGASGLQRLGWCEGVLCKPGNLSSTPDLTKDGGRAPTPLCHPPTPSPWYVCVCTHTCVSALIRVCLCSYMCVCAHPCVSCSHACAHTCVSALIHVCLCSHVCLRSYMCVCAHTCVCTHTCVYIHTCVSARTHTCHTH